MYIRKKPQNYVKLVRKKTMKCKENETNQNDVIK